VKQIAAKDTVFEVQGIETLLFLLNRPAHRRMVLAAFTSKVTAVATVRSCGGPAEGAVFTARKNGIRMTFGRATRPRFIQFLTPRLHFEIALFSEGRVG
jgi:hypothetical protein